MWSEINIGTSYKIECFLSGSVIAWLKKNGKHQIAFEFGFIVVDGGVNKVSRTESSTFPKCCGLVVQISGVDLLGPTRGGR